MLRAWPRRTMPDFRNRRPVALWEGAEEASGLGGEGRHFCVYTTSHERGDARSVGWIAEQGPAKRVFEEAGLAHAAAAI